MESLWFVNLNPLNPQTRQAPLRKEGGVVILIVI